MSGFNNLRNAERGFDFNRPLQNLRRSNSAPKSLKTLQQTAISAELLLRYYQYGEAAGLHFPAPFTCGRCVEFR